MSDQPPVPPTQPTPPVPPPPPPAAPAAPGGASWQGVQPVVERPTEAMPPVPPGTPPPAPPTGPGGGGAPGGGGGANTGLIVAIVVVLVAILGVGGFLLLSGDDDGDDDVATDDRDRDEDEDEETTTTEEEDEETTTTEAEETTTTEAEETTTTVGGGDGGELAFTQIRDDTGELVVEVPDFWTEVDGTPLNPNSPNVQASDDLAAFRTLAVSGVSYSRLENRNVDVDATLDFLMDGQLDSCQVGERVDYSDAIFTGRVQQLVECTPAGAELLILVANATDGRAVELSTIIVPGDPGEEIFQHLLDTFTLAEE